MEAVCNGGVSVTAALVGLSADIVCAQENQNRVAVKRGRSQERRLQYMATRAGRIGTHSICVGEQCWVAATTRWTRAIGITEPEVLPYATAGATARTACTAMSVFSLIWESRPSQERPLIGKTMTARILLRTAAGQRTRSNRKTNDAGESSDPSGVESRASCGVCRAFAQQLR